MAIGNGDSRGGVGHSREMPQAAADHLATVVKPRREALGTQTAVAKVWGIAQSHISQIEKGHGCGVAVLFTLRRRLNLSLEELCFPPGKRLPVEPKQEAAPIDAGVIRAAVQQGVADALAEAASKSTPPSEPPPIASLPPKRASTDAPPRPRRR